MRTVMARYRQMDLADASIVVMSELQPRSQVLTVDRGDQRLSAQRPPGHRLYRAAQTVVVALSIAVVRAHPLFG